MPFISVKFPLTNTPLPPTFNPLKVQLFVRHGLRLVCMKLLIGVGLEWECSWCRVGIVGFNDGLLGCAVAIDVAGSLGAGFSFGLVR